MTPQRHKPPRRARRRNRGFTLVELVLNVIIIGMIASIAVPRISQAAAQAKGKSVSMTLTLVRSAIEHYYAEHGRYPGYIPGSDTPNDSAFIKQLTLYTDIAGNTNQKLEYPFIYGPYIRAPFPTNPLNDLSTVKMMATQGSLVAVNTTGWKAFLDTGHFTANSAKTAMRDVGVAEGVATELRLP